jgi:chorismate synthase
MKGDAKDPQLAKLRPILSPIGGGAVSAGIRAVWGDEAVSRLTAAQAQALLNVAASRGESFAAEFKAAETASAAA